MRLSLLGDVCVTPSSLDGTACLLTIGRCTELHLVRFFLLWSVVHKLIDFSETLTN